MICCGVIGKAVDIVGVCTAPVTAQVMMAFLFAFMTGHFQRAGLTDLLETMP